MTRHAAVGMLTALSLSGCATFHQPQVTERCGAVLDGLIGELRRSVEILAGDIGERNCYRPQLLEKAAAWIEHEFVEAGFAPRRLPVDVPNDPRFDCGAMTVWNIEAEKRGQNRSNEVIVVGAHYDTKVATRSWLGWGKPLKHLTGTPGADDNASGIAALLALSRRFAGTATSRTIRLVAFVNEERPFFQTESMGSRVYARHCRARTNETVLAMISLDTLGRYSEGARKKRCCLATLVGLPARTDYVAFLGLGQSRLLMQQAAETFARHSPVPVRTVVLPQIGKLVAWSDDWSFAQEYVPAFVVTDTAFLRHDDYHELSDTAEKLNYEPFAAVVHGLRSVVEALANPDEAETVTSPQRAPRQKRDCH